MTDAELVELMYRWEELKQEYETFLESDVCKQIKEGGGNEPSMLEWVTELREVAKEQKCCYTCEYQNLRSDDYPCVACIYNPCVKCIHNSETKEDKWRMWE